MNEQLADEAAKTLALVASEWFKTARRLARLTQEVAPGRLERERAQLSFAQNRIEISLARLGIRLVTHDGLPFTPELPAEPVNPEDFDTEEGLLVRETLEPTVLFEGRIVARGRVVLGKEG